MDFLLKQFTTAICLIPYRNRMRCSDSCNYSTVLYRLFQATVCVRGTVHGTAIFILSHQVTDNIYVNTVRAESSDRSPGGTCQDRQGREKELKQGFYESNRGLNLTSLFNTQIYRTDSCTSRRF